MISSTLENGWERNLSTLVIQYHYTLKTSLFNNANTFTSAIRTNVIFSNDDNKQAAMGIMNMGQLHAEEPAELGQLTGSCLSIDIEEY